MEKLCNRGNPTCFIWTNFKFRVSLHSLLDLKDGSVKHENEVWVGSKPYLIIFKVEHERICVNFVPYLLFWSAQIIGKLSQLWHKKVWPLITIIFITWHESNENQILQQNVLEKIAFRSWNIPDLTLPWLLDFFSLWITILSVSCLMVIWLIRSRRFSI